MLLCFLANLLIACGVCIALVSFAIIVCWVFIKLERNFGNGWAGSWLVFLFIALLSLIKTLIECGIHHP